MSNLFTRRWTNGTAPHYGYIFLEWFVYNYFQTPTKCVGFSIHYNHCLDIPQREIWDYLQDGTQIMVIHLKRNVLASYISEQMVLKTGR